MVKPYVAQQTVDDFGQVFSDIKYTASIAATTDTTITVPSSAPRFKMIVKVENNTWMALNGTAAVPAGGSFAASTSELVLPYEKVCRDVKAGDVVHFYTATAGTDISVVFYAMNNTSGI